MIKKRSKLDFSLVWLFFGSYCSHHTRREKFNSFPATHNILFYFFSESAIFNWSTPRFSRWYLIGKCIKFWLEVNTPIFLYNHSEASVTFIDFANQNLTWTVSKRSSNVACPYSIPIKHTKFSVLRLIPRLWYSCYLKFLNSKLKFEIKNQNL